MGDCFKQSAAIPRSEREAGRSALVTDSYWRIDNASAFVVQLGCLTGDRFKQSPLRFLAIMAVVHRPIRFIR
jgi:hypothetical protein